MLRRLTLTGLVAMWTLIAIAAPSHALQIDGVFTEDRNAAENTPDSFSIANHPTSIANIIQIRIDLTTSANNAVFDPAGSPFVVLPGSDPVGFSGTFSLSGNQVLTLTFTDFQPGETFLFGVDVDDDNGRFVQGSDFDSAILEGMYQGVSGVVQGFYVGSGFSASVTAVPEPGTAGPVGLGLAWLAGIARRRRASR